MSHEKSHKLLIRMMLFKENFDFISLMDKLNGHLQWEYMCPKLDYPTWTLSGDARTYASFPSKLQCPTVHVLKPPSLLFPPRVGHFGDFYLNLSWYLGIWGHKSKSWRLTEVNPGCLNTGQGKQRAWNTDQPIPKRFAREAVPHYPTDTAGHSKMLGASASLRLKWEQQTLRTSVLCLIRLISIKPPRTCRAEEMLMKEERCLFQRDRGRKWYGGGRLRSHLCLSFKNACWIVRAAGVAQSSMIGQDIFLLEISRVNLVHSLLYFLHKNLFTQELRLWCQHFLISFIN